MYPHYSILLTLFPVRIKYAAARWYILRHDEFTVLRLYKQERKMFLLPFKRDVKDVEQTVS